MFDHDHSAARGKMTARKLIVFKHESALGNAPTQKLFDLITIKRNGDVKAPARAYADYLIAVNKNQVAAGVTLEDKI